MKHPRVFHKKIEKFRLAIIRAKMAKKSAKRTNFEKILAFRWPTLDLNAEIHNFGAAAH